MWWLEKYNQFFLVIDVLFYCYGVIVLLGKLKGVVFGDFWEEGDKRFIYLKEVEVLLKVVQLLGLEIKNYWLYILIDNKVVFFFW